MKHVYLADVLALAEDGLSAQLVIERLGIPRSVRTVERWVHDELGAWPTQVKHRPDNWLKDMALAEMVELGQRADYCVEGHLFRGEPFIRRLKHAHGLGDCVVVCGQHSRPGDV